MRFIFGMLSAAIITQIVFISHPASAADPLEVKKLPPPNKATVEAKASENAFQPASSSDRKLMRTLDKNYQNASSVSMSVEHTRVNGVLGGEGQKSKGTLLISRGRIHLELEGDGKTALIVNEKKFWSVTYPSPEFKESKFQIVTGSISSRKGASQSILGVLVRGGFLKFFNVTGVLKNPGGDLTYFMQPEKQTADFKRAQLRISPDGKEIHELRYWDEKGNEVSMVFSDITFGKKLKDADFNYDPPADADITTF